MKISTSMSDGRLRLYLSGELDHHAAKDGIQIIRREIDRNLPRDCVMDLRELTFMDSSGIAVLLGTHKQMREIGGRFWAVNVQKQPMKVLNASGIYRIVEIVEGEEIGI